MLEASFTSCACSCACGRVVEARRCAWGLLGNVDMALVLLARRSLRLLRGVHAPPCVFTLWVHRCMVIWS